MSDSPPKAPEEEHATQSAGEAEEPMEPGEGPLPDFDVKEQDRWLPIANVARIMKLALPDNAKIAKEAKECMQECVSEFISFITSEALANCAQCNQLGTSERKCNHNMNLTKTNGRGKASEKCQQEKRKTVNGEDILFAMTSLGFENYAEALKIYLSKYRETQSARGENQPNQRPSTSGGGGGGNPTPTFNPSADMNNHGGLDDGDHGAGSGGYAYAGIGGGPSTTNGNHSSY